MPEQADFNLGPDKVRIQGDVVTIHAARVMADWVIREFQRPPIYFRGKKYLLQRKTPGPAPYAITYELVPWPAEPGRESKLSITYDEEYVRERDLRDSADRKQGMIYPALVCIYPLLGFAWSGVKESVLAPLGLESGAITAASTLLTFAIFLLEGIFVFYFQGGLIAPFCGRELYDSVLWLDRLLLVILPLDAAIRYGQVIHGEGTPDGFLEWAFKWTKKGV